MGLAGHKILVSSVLAVVVSAACSEADSGRDQATGTEFQAERELPPPAPPPPPAAAPAVAPPVTPPAAPQGPGDGGGDDVGETEGGESQDPLTETSKTLEQCTAEKKAWIPVPVPSKCGEPLVVYCCTKEEIFKRFPQQEAKLKPLFEQAEAAGTKLYHCSSTAEPKKTTFHFARIGGDPSLLYKVIFTTSTPFDAPPAANCPTVETDDLKVAAP